MLKVKVHRGTHQIGGSITEIYTDNTHILIDFGSELNTDSENSTDAEMVDMIHHAKCDAVLFTHNHGDHIGLLQQIPRNDVDGKVIKLAMGKVSRKVLINIHKTLTQFPEVAKEHEDYINTLSDLDRSVDLEDGVPVFFGESKDIKVTPLHVDHSAYDAFMFIVEAEGKTIVHTGDYRTHGRLGKDFFPRLENVLAGKTVDALITEGTMMSRLGEEVLTEEELQKQALDVLKKPENKWAFLICSSTNVESLASFANAAMYLGRAFYVNYYVYEQILLYRETAGEEDKAFKFWKTYKFESMNKYNPKLKMTQPEFMKENGFLMLIGASEAYKYRMDYFKAQDPLLIYSMWKGYVDEESDAYDEELGALYNGWNPNRREYLHTSGHATADTIREMILTVKPQKYIIPIHTENPNRFKKLDISDYAEKVLNVKDNNSISLD